MLEPPLPFVKVGWEGFKTLSYLCRRVLSPAKSENKQHEGADGIEVPERIEAQGIFKPQIEQAHGLPSGSTL